MNRVLVAGVGNVFLSDDGFGVEVARRLTERALPAGVEVADVGIRGLHLAYRLLDGYRALVLVDTYRHGEPPGTLYLIEHDLDGPADDAVFDAHGMDPGAVLGMLDQLAEGVGRRPARRPGARCRLRTGVPGRGDRAHGTGGGGRRPGHAGGRRTGRRPARGGEEMIKWLLVAAVVVGVAAVASQASDVKRYRKMRAM